MGNKEFVIWLSDKDWILVVIKTTGKKFISYIVKYMAIIEDIQYEIARFDSGHDYVHADLLRPDGSKERIVRFPSMNEEDIINFAISSFKINFEIYRKRFEQWLNGRE